VRKTILLAMLVAVALIGCMSTATLQKSLDDLTYQWEGRPAADFFTRYGLPIRSIPSGDGMLYQWRSDVQDFMVGTGAVKSLASVYCELTITADAEGRIRGIQVVYDSIGLWTNSRFYEIFGPDV